MKNLILAGAFTLNALLAQADGKMSDIDKGDPITGAHWKNFEFELSGNIPQPRDQKNRVAFFRGHMTGWLEGMIDYKVPAGEVNKRLSRITLENEIVLNMRELFNEPICFLEFKAQMDASQIVASEENRFRFTVPEPKRDKAGVIQPTVDTTETDCERGGQPGFDSSVRIVMDNDQLGRVELSCQRLPLPDFVKECRNKPLDVPDMMRALNGECGFKCDNFKNEHFVKSPFRFFAQDVFKNIGGSNE